MAMPVATEERCIAIQDNGRNVMVAYARLRGSFLGHIQ
jgi:hypothetical protein